jgi:regulator of ribonuclease activity A
VIYGAIRDSAIIDGMDLGVKALGTVPRKTVKKDRGDVGVSVSFGGVTFQPGHYLYADADGIVVAEKAIHGA